MGKRNIKALLTRNAQNMKCAKNPFEQKTFDCQKSQQQQYVPLFRIAFEFSKEKKNELALLSLNEKNKTLAENESYLQNRRKAFCDSSEAYFSLKINNAKGNKQSAFCDGVKFHFTIIFFFF